MAISKIKIPSKVYVGFQGRRSQDEVPLGFMGVYNETKASQSKQATIDKWASGNGSQSKVFNSVILDNTPMIGFKIGRAISRSKSWGGRSTVVRVEDPRGFELEISVDNIVMCMDSAILEYGEIMHECVWGVEGSMNILLPTNSEPYLEFLETADKFATAIPLRSVNNGDTIELVDGTVGVYMGSLFPIRRVADRTNDGTLISLQIGDKRLQVLKTTNSNGITKYEGFSSFKISKIVNKASMTLEEVDAEIFSAMTDKEIQFAGPHSKELGNCYKGFVSSQKGTVVSNYIVEVTEQEVKDNKAEWVNKYPSFLIFAQSVTGECVHLSDHYELNFVMNRQAPNRSYKPLNSSMYYYSDRDFVKTAGFVGYPATILDGELYYSNRSRTHIDADKFTRFVMVKSKITTSHGITFEDFV